MKAKKVTLRKA
jgi:hypothetical protein